MKRTFASPGAINCVKFIPNSEYSLVSGCSNGTTYLYDLRGLKELGQFRDIRQSPISALTSSLSGRLLFTGNE